MLRNYCKIALRNLSRNRFQAAINITGLALGIAVALLIGLWILDEVSFDRYHTNHRRIAEVLLTQTDKHHAYTGPTVATPHGVALHQNYGELFERVGMISYPWDAILTVGDKHLQASTVCAEHEIPEMFTFRMIRGSAASIADPYTLIIAQSMAKALFGNADPMGRNIVFNGRTAVRVGGVFDDPPRNTTFSNLKVLISWKIPDNGLQNVTAWNDHGIQLFVQLRPGVTFAQAEARIKGVPTPFVQDVKEESYLQPLDKLHFCNEIIDGDPQDKALTMVWIVGLIGCFILLLACINFMNLSTARSERRAREVGIRKTVGTTRSQLVAQFLVESVLVTAIAAALSLGLAQLALPSFNDLADKDVALPLTQPSFWLAWLAVTLLVGLVAGSYPAFYLSGFKPIRVLKGVFAAGKGAARPREVLVVFQFAVTLVLVIATIIAFRQIGHAKDRPLGYNQSGLVTVNINTQDLDKHYDALRTDLLKTGLFENIARASQSTSQFGNNNSVEWPGMDPSQLSIYFRNVNVSREFGTTIGWRILSGRDFSNAFAGDSSAVILNRTAARIIGNQHPVGMVVKFFGKPYTVIGIAEDMLTNEPFSPIEPAIFLGDGYKGIITLRIKTGVPIHQAVDAMSKAFRLYNPASPFIYTFNDDAFARKFTAEERVEKLAGVFALLAIVISCLGLFGLASFMAEQRTKEIGVRKVLGAGLFSLWGLLSKDFARLAAIALAIAIPASWWLMHGWLQQYPYRTALSWWIFAAAGSGMVLLALATVSYQCLHAALRNPIDSLRSE
ncbi:MAG TPA: ABC transporter permease [Dinghuibacter sp.]|uniref:ABC transporter permease n=1 Tax=Dinghuibacter sp. TaxID=2024697 RepID=UPI002BE5BF4E|nr:ABC transporter permease [Dinghuibacter sp.]HTJ11920.1 ABC transporter permease [Dinghuibacter sp.]